MLLIKKIREWKLGKASIFYGYPWTKKNMVKFYQVSIVWNLGGDSYSCFDGCISFIAFSNSKHFKFFFVINNFR